MQVIIGIQSGIKEQDKQIRKEDEEGIFSIIIFSKAT